MRISKGALPLILGNYARNYDINLYMKGSFAYTNGRSIVIPRLHLDDHDSLEMAYGYVAHECGHIRYSDFSLLKGLENQQVLRTLFNAIEDPRIEYLQIANWPGLKETFNFLIQKLEPLSLSCLKKKQQTCGNDCTAILLMFCNFYLRYTEVKQDAAEKLYLVSEKFLTELIGKGAVKCIKKILTGTTKAADSGMVLCTARKVISFINTIAPMDKNSPEANDCEMNSRDMEQSGADDSNTISHDSFTGKQLELDEDSINELIEDYKKNPERFTKLKLSSNSTENLALINYGIKEYLNEKSDNVDIDEEFGVMQPGLATPRENSNLYKRVILDPVLLNQLQDLVAGYDRWKHGFTSAGNLLNIPRYALRKSGHSLDNRVFNKSTIHRAPNTFIHLLVDSSGSMYTRCHSSKKYRYEVANEAALSLALALEKHKNIDTEVTYFPGVNTEFETVAKPREFIASKAAYFDQRPKGGTPMAQALMHAVYNFPNGPLKRNIVFIITDGDPDNPQAVYDILKDAKKRGVEVYAIRIGRNTCCPDLFANSRIIEDVSELSDAMLSMLNTSLYELAA